MTASRFQKPIRFLQNRLSPHGYAGLHLTVGVLVGRRVACCYIVIIIHFFFFR
jgi:hypothetical protein